MKSCLRWFNIYLLFAFVLSGCVSDRPRDQKLETKKEKEPKEKLTREQKKELSSVHLHLETFPDGTGASGTVLVTRQQIPVNIEREPFLNEGDIVSAAIVPSFGGFEVQLFFDHHGTFYLDMVTTSNKGRRIALLAQYPQPKKKQFSRWVAAPVIARRMANGVLAFTPDLSKEEAERWVRGLNNVAAKAKKESKF